MRPANVFIAVLSVALLTVSVRISFAGTTGILEGHVRDKNTAEPLVGATIHLVGTPLGAVTNADGFYAVNAVPSGLYNVEINYIGYQKTTVTGLRIVPDLKTKLDIDLLAVAVEMQPVEVVAVRPPIQKDVTGTVYNTSRDAFDLLPVTTVSEAIALQPGVTLENNIRGGKTTEVVYLVDGLPIQNLIEGGAGTELPQSSIAEVAVQTGGFEPEYGNALSGVINVITKRATERHDVLLRVEKDDLFGGAEVDHRNEVDVSASGPITSTLSYVGSAGLLHTDTRWWQDQERFFDSPIARTYSGLAKLDYQPSSDVRVGVQGLYSYRKWRDYEFAWRFNLDGLPARKEDGYRIAGTFSHSPSTTLFYNASVSRYKVNTHINDGSRGDVDTTLYRWDFYLQYITDGNRSWWARREQVHNLVKADMTWRLDEHHLVKLGGEMNFQEIFSDVVRYEPVLNIFGKPFVNKPLLNYSTDYRYLPRTGSAYLQDKIELSKDGMLLNIGFRYDFLDPRAERPLAERVPDQNGQYVTQITGTAPASIKHMFSPRFGFAAPFAVHGYLFINYGVYHQTPLFDYLYSGLNNVSLSRGVGVLVGNPDLRPERTRAWEMSIKYALPQGVILSGTYFNKETTNMIDVKTFVPTNARVAGGYGFAEFVNTPFAKASGIELIVSREEDKLLTGSISYTFMTAEGVSENARGGLEYYQWGFPVPATPFPLSWDQRHTVKLIASLRLPWDIVFSSVWTYHSGRPYTYFPSRDGFTPEDPEQEFEPNNARLKDYNTLNLKVSKSIDFDDDIPVRSLSLYVDGRNIFDDKNVRWSDSSGRVGGELGDITAMHPGRRIRVGMRVDL